MITPDGRRCDIKDCRGVGVHYGMDNRGNYGDLCGECFVIYNSEVLRGNGTTPKPYLECQYCGKRVHMMPAQFTRAMHEIDNREKKRPLSPKFACPTCARGPGILSRATLSIGTVVFAEAM
jgi:DNA-directed RNA polymerase subunit RPC12/RpoP